MRLSIQRQCDGHYNKPGASRCTARLELTIEVKDRSSSPDPQHGWLAWEEAAMALGWRRAGGAGVPQVRDHFSRGIGIPDVDDCVVVPSTKTWVVCPEHAAGYFCIRCKCASPACSCMGGPRFDVTDTRPA